MNEPSTIEDRTNSPGARPLKISFFKALIVVVLISFLLYFGKALFIPLSFALLISCILHPFSRWLEKKGISPVISIAISMMFIVLLFAGMATLLTWQILQFANEWPLIQAKFTSAANDFSVFLTQHLNISIADQESWWDNFSDNTGTQMIPILSTTIGSITLFSVFVVLVPIMSALILYYRTELFEALHNFIPGTPVYKLKDILHDTISTYYNFIKGMLVVYLVVGILNSVGLLILGVPHAFLFGFIAAILTFIPYVGIIIGAILPMVVAWITYNSLWYPAGVIIIFTIVQYLEANLIFPWAVSNKLQINTLATIVVILVGGIIWGSAGMILFIPYLGILKLLADRTEGHRGISLLLGTKTKNKK